MPQHDPEDEDFWTRSRRTRQSDKASSRRGRKPKETGTKGGADWTEPERPPAAPPAARRPEPAPPDPSPPRSPRSSAAPPAAPSRGASRPPRAEPPYPAAPTRRGSAPSPTAAPRPEPYPTEPPSRRSSPPPRGRGGSPDPAPRSEPSYPTEPPSRRSSAPPPGRAARGATPSPDAEPGDRRGSPPGRAPGAAAAARNAASPPDVASRGPAGGASSPRTSSRDPFAGPGAASQAGAGRPDTSRPPGAARRTGRLPADASGPPTQRSRAATPSGASTTNGPHLAGRTAPAAVPGADPGWTSPAPLAPAPEHRPTTRQPAVGGRTGVRTTGENPSLDDRLEGLASRAATEPHGGARAPVARPAADEEPLTPDPLIDQRATAAAPAYDKGYDDNYGGDLYDDAYTDDEPYDDYEPAPAHRNKPGCISPLPIAFTALGIVCVLFLMGAFWVKRQIDPGGPPGDKVRIEIVAGQSTGEIGSTLENAGIIESSSVWTWYIRLKGGGDIQAGVYDIPTNLSMDEALKALEAKPLPPGTKTVTVPEGQTVLQMQARLTESDKKVDGFTPEGFAAALADPAVRSKYLKPDQPVEGTFFPNTYDLAKDATEKTALAKMRDEFDATMDDLGVNAGAQALGRDPYEILIIASIIEEEARVDEDRAKIARVIYNHLDQDIALYIDAINCYDLNPEPCVPSKVDFEADSPYNSRKVKGLPPTPISAPGRASLEAALHPAEGDWLYYVLDPEMPEGQHFFTASNDEFLAAKARCRNAGLGCG